MLDPEIEEGIERYINHIRQMNMLTDDQLRVLLRQKAVENPEMFLVFKEAAVKKSLQEMKKMAKEIQGDPRKFARKVDDIRVDDIST